MATFGAPFHYFEGNQLTLEDDKKHVNLEVKELVEIKVKEEFVEIKEETYETYSTENWQSSNIDGNVLSQNIDTSDFDAHIVENFKKSDIHKKQNEHKCSQCDFGTNSMYKLKHHIVKVHNIGAYECPNCDYRTPIEGDLKTHLKLKTACQNRMARQKKLDEIDISQEYCTKEEDGFRCIYCEYNSTHKYMLKRHFCRVHLHQKTFESEKSDSSQLKARSCPHCEFKTPYLESHMVRKHPEKCDPSQLKTYSCLHCEFKTSYKRTLNSHMVRNHPEKWNPSHMKSHSCELCEFETPSKMILKLHMSRKHPKIVDPSKLKFHSCLHCEFQTLDKRTLKSHMLRKHPEKCDPSHLKMNSCLYCEFKSTYLDSHMLHKHPEKCDPSQLKIHCCLHCEFKTSYKITLESHMMRNHPEKCDPSQLKIHFCLYCVFKTPYKRNLELHMFHKHPEFCDPLMLKTHSCLQCEFKTPYLGSQRPKKCDRSQLEKKRNVCHLCGKTYSLICSLRRHMEIKHVNEKKRCSLCDYSCIRNKELVFHMKRYHERKKLFQCYDCGFTSPSKLILREHILGKHLKREEYRCDMCSFKTLYRKTLKAHKKVHYCPERLACEYCSFITLNSEALEKHTRVQHNDSLLKCDQCDYMTFTKCYLPKHIDHKHNKAEYICELCGTFTFKDRDTLLFHMYKVHGTQPELCQEDPNLDIVRVKVEENEDQGTDELKINEQIKQDIKLETIYFPSLPDYQEDAISSHLDVNTVKAEENENQRTETLKANKCKEQIKQEIKMETVYLPSFLDYQDKMSE